MDLREKIAALIHRHKLKGSNAVAGMILELPEIAEAQKRIAELEAQIEAASEDALGYSRYPDSWT